MKEEQQFWQELKRVLAEAPEPVCAEADWEALAQQLPPAKKRRRYFIIWFLIGLGLISATLAQLTNQSTPPQEDHPMEQDQQYNETFIASTKNQQITPVEQNWIKETKQEAVLTQVNKGADQAPSLESNDLHHTTQMSSEETVEVTKEKSQVLFLNRLAIHPISKQKQEQDELPSIPYPESTKNPRLFLGVLGSWSSSRPGNQRSMSGYGISVQKSIARRFDARLQLHYQRWQGDSNWGNADQRVIISPDQEIYGYDIIGYRKNNQSWSLQTAILYQLSKKTKWQPYLGAELDINLSRQTQQDNRYQELSYDPVIISRRFESKDNSLSPQETKAILGLNYRLHDKWRFQLEGQYRLWQKRDNPKEAYPLQWQLGFQYKLN